MSETAILAIKIFVVLLILFFLYTTAIINMFPVNATSITTEYIITLKAFNCNEFVSLDVHSGGANVEPFRLLFVMKSVIRLFVVGLPVV